MEDEEDAVNLRKWVAFANVPLKDRDSKSVLKTVPLPSDHQALKWLAVLGFKLDTETNKIYRLRPHLESGKEEFRTVDSIRTFVRVSPDEVLLATPNDDDVFSPRKRSRRASRKNDDSALKEEEILALRLWGALSPAPIPTFGTDADSDDEGEETHPSQSSSGSQCVIL